MPAHSAEIRFDPTAPPVAILAAAESIQAATKAASASASASSSSASAAAAAAHVQLLPTAGATVPTLTLPNSTQVLSGSSLLLRYLGRVGCEELGLSLYGRGAAQSVQVDFFLDLAPALANKDTLNQYAKIIDEHLANRTTLVGDKGITIADLSVWENITGQSLAHTPTPSHTQHNHRQF